VEQEAEREDDCNYRGPGVYEHYKGNFYYVLGLAVREESKEDGWIVEVIYFPLDRGTALAGHEAKFWSRQLDDFDAQVNIEGLLLPRFRRCH
jgi:hypothetical protein